MVAGPTVVTSVAVSVERDTVVVTMATELAAVVVPSGTESGNSALLVCTLLICDVIGADGSSLVAFSMIEETVESIAVLVSSVGVLTSMLVVCRVTTLRVVVVSLGKLLAVMRPLLSARSFEVTTAVENADSLGSTSEVSNVDTVTVDGTGKVTVDGK